MERMATRYDPEEDFEPITRLLDMALEFANNTWNEPAYYVLVAAGELAFEAHLKRQVINTARFIGTNAHFTEQLGMGGTDKWAKDFVALADTLVRKEIRHRVWWDEYSRAHPIVPPSAAERARWDEERAAMEARSQAELPVWQAQYRAAMAEALAYRNHRQHDDD